MVHNLSNKLSRVNVPIDNSHPNIPMRVHRLIPHHTKQWVIHCSQNFAKNTGALARANDVMIRTDHICDAGPRVAHAALEWEILPLSINSCPISLVQELLLGTPKSLSSLPPNTPYSRLLRVFNIAKLMRHRS